MYVILYTMVIHRYLQCATAVANHFQAAAALDQPVHINSAGVMSAVDAMSAASCEAGTSTAQPVAGDA